MFDVLLPRFEEVSRDKLELKVVLVAFPFLGESEANFFCLLCCGAPKLNFIVLSMFG